MLLYLYTMYAKYNILLVLLLYAEIKFEGPMFHERVYKRISSLSVDACPTNLI